MPDSRVVHMIEMHALGAVRVTVEGEDVSLGGPRQRRLLAVLLIHRNAVVSVDRIAEAVFAGAPTAAAGATLRSYVARLRKVLELDGTGARLVTRAPGYQLTRGRFVLRRRGTRGAPRRGPGRAAPQRPRGWGPTAGPLNAQCSLGFAAEKSPDTTPDGFHSRRALRPKGPAAEFGGADEHWLGISSPTVRTYSKCDRPARTHPTALTAKRASFRRSTAMESADRVPGLPKLLALSAAAVGPAAVPRPQRSGG